MLLMYNLKGKLSQKARSPPLVHLSTLEYYNLGILNLV